MSNTWRGIFPIAATPYTESLELDEESLRREVRFCIDAGVSGLAGPAFASEFMVLSDDERRRWMQVVIDEAAGRVPVIIAVHQVHTVPAVALARYAQDLGADAIMNMPPHVAHFSVDECYEHYRTLADAVTVPVVIQNMVGPVGTPLSSAMLARLCRECEQIQYIKEETLPEPRKIAATLAAAGDDCRGVFGGRNGIHIIDEFLRGSCGNMPGAVTPDIHVDLWEMLEAGEEEGARALYARILPLFTLQSNYGPLIRTEIMHRRGIFATKRTRLPGAILTEADYKEFERLYAEIESLTRI